MVDRVFVGVDVGGTKTHVRVQRSAAANAVEVVRPTATWRRTGNVADAPALLDMIRGIAGHETVDAIAVGAHGCDSADDCASFENALRRSGAAPVRVVNDAELFAPAAGLPGGIGLVAGTGSIAVGRRADGTMLAAGGWGWILGDEGSAAGLVREAVRAVRGAIDAAEPRDGLYEALCATLGARSETEFGRRLDVVHGAAGWGSHAAAVFAAAEKGSRLAQGVIREGAQALAVLVKRVADRGAASRQVVAAGGVIVAQPLLYELFRQALGEIVPQAEATLLRTPPVAGAVVLAQRLVASIADPAVPGASS